MKDPALSVVVIVLIGGDTLIRCLEALSQQRGITPDIIVPYDEHHRAAEALRTRFPEVTFLPIEGHHTYAELRTIGVQAARHDVLALTEDHCIPSPEWGAEILKAHAGPYVAVGGAVDKKTPDTTINWALYLADYVRYANPAEEGPVDHLTDCNVSYKKAALDAVASVWRREFHEPEVHAALQGQGGTLLLSPRVLVLQQRTMTLRNAVRDRYAFGRLFGGRRAEAVSARQRWIYAGSALLLPVLLVMRVVGHVLRKRRYVGALLRAFPAVVLLNSVWAWGEFLGYLTGRSATSLTPGQRREVVLPAEPREA